MCFLSTPFWEFRARSCLCMYCYRRYAEHFLLPFGSFWYDPYKAFAVFEVADLKQLSTPFWEFPKIDALVEQAFKEIDFLLPFGSFYTSC
jgi:hypothetical protein